MCPDEEKEAVTRANIATGKIRVIIHKRIPMPDLERNFFDLIVIILLFLKRFLKKKYTVSFCEVKCF